MPNMRSLLASNRGNSHRKGRNSTPSVATAPNYVVSSLPLGASDGTGYRYQGVLLGIDAQTQAQQVADWQGVLQYLAPKCYGIRGSNVLTNRMTYSNQPSNAVFVKLCSESDNSHPSPGGGSNAFTLFATRVSPGMYRPLTNIPNYVVGNWYMASVAISEDSVPLWFLMISYATTGNPGAWFNTKTGLVGTVAPGVTAWSTPDVGGFNRFHILFQATSGSASELAFYSAFNDGNAEGADGNWYGYGIQIVDMTHLPAAQRLPVPYIPEPIATPVTRCYDHLPDGTPLRPFYSFSGTHRYDVFRPTELARNMAFNVGDCIEAVASDGVRRYYQCAAVNVALATNGGVASASSTYQSSYPAYSTIDGDRKGLNWGNYGGWASAALPAWLQVTFPSSKLISEIDVFTVQDNDISPVEPTPNMTCLVAGNKDFNVEYWNGSAFVPVAGGTVVGNTLVWRKFTFPTITTDRIRVNITSSYLGNNARLVEVEAWNTIGGTTGATSPTFPPTGTVVDGGVTWTAAGYATIIGLELAQTGSVNHPEGVYLELIGANAKNNDQIMCYDFFPDVTTDSQAMSTNAQVYSGWAVDHMQSYVGGQQRAGNGGKVPGRFTRMIIRMSTTAHTLYNDGAMFTGASGGGFTPSLVIIGGLSAALQTPKCILNWFILLNAAMNDAQATARSQFDLKPSVGLNALTGAYSSQV